MRVTCFLLAVVVSSTLGRNALAFPNTPADPLPSIEEKVIPLEYHAGFFDLYWDAAAGSVLLKIDRWGDEFLMIDALASGLGSNPVGLDRGQLGQERLCRWRRVGNRVFLEQQNTRFRAVGAPQAEQQAVADSFAPSILWAGTVQAAEMGKPISEAAVLIDVTSLIVADRHRIAQTLDSTGQGKYRLALDESTVWPQGLKGFPDNIEMESWLTFAADKAGSQVRAVAATGESFTLRQRISLVRLPDQAYEPRRFSPRVGSFSVDYADYAVPLDQPIHQSWMTRHRLNAEQPIVYYVDPGAPEPIRSALVEGASWWAEAFEAAGYPNGFQVKVAPEGMDPLDVRYNYIQWVHRQTRGWSYGASVTDPRTGEILKGHVSLGSLRVRQDRLLFNNFGFETQPKPAGAACACGMPAAAHGLNALAAARLNAAPDSTQASVETALARIRQLAAHEVGHTLGLAHNFAASTYGDRASVMDYPAPRIKLDANGELDFSDAYGIGVGSWDRFAIRAMYEDFKTESELEELIQQSISNGLIYLSDSDARPPYAADPRATLWDDGEDPTDALRHAMKVRKIGMDRFGEQVLLAGETSGDLMRYFAPLYFHHRFQVEGTAKVVGGVTYAYSRPGDADAKAQDVPPEHQKQAMAALLETLEPKQLTVSARLAELLVPAGASANSWSMEEASGRANPIFDPLSLAETASRLTLHSVLNPQRMGRLPLQAARDENHPGFRLVFDALSEFAGQLADEQEDPLQTMIAKRVFAAIVDEMIEVAQSQAARQDVRAAAREFLRIDMLELLGRSPAVPEFMLLRNRVEQILERPDLPAVLTPARPAPPGSPIGGRSVNAF